MRNPDERGAGERIHAETPAHQAAAAMLPRITHTSMQERVYLELRSALMAGLFQPGQAITMQALADSFGVSTMPIRDALRRLVAERVVEVLSNRSVAIPRLSAERFQDLLRVRVVLEGQAVAWAAENLTPAVLENLEALNEEMNQPAAQADVGRFLVLNQQFHFGIYRAARSEVLMPIIESMWLRVGPYINLLLHEMLRAPRRNVHHNTAIAALRRYDADAARRAIEKDLLASADVVMPLVRKFDSETVATGRKLRGRTADA